MNLSIGSQLMVDRWLANNATMYIIAKDDVNVVLSSRKSFYLK